MQRHRMTPECRGGRRYGKIKMGEIWRGGGGGGGGGKLLWQIGTFFNVIFFVHVLTGWECYAVAFIWCFGKYHQPFSLPGQYFLEKILAQSTQCAMLYSTSTFLSCVTRFDLVNRNCIMDCILGVITYNLRCATSFVYFFLHMTN